MSDQKPDENHSKNTINYYSIPPMSDDHLRLWLQNAPIISSISMEDLQAQAEIPSLQKANPGDQNPCLDDIILHDFNNDQSSCTERKYASDHFLEMQTKEGDAEVGAKEDSECKQRKRKRYSKVHNLNDRLRRQKLTKKMKALQEMIPNSNKRDKASTLDEAIKYIQTLQYQVQMMSIGAGYTMFHSPLMMITQPGQQGMQIPSLAPFLHTGMKYGIETGMSGMFSSFNFPMSQLGLPNPCLLPSSSAAATAHSIQNPGNFLGPLYATSFPYFGSLSNK